VSSRPGAKLKRTFYARDTLTVARELIGMHLIYRYGDTRLAGRIVETEAYQGPEDLAAHSARGRTARTEVMFGPPGHAYVYLIYGIWDCLNVVSNAQGTPHAVLIRALEPIQGIERTWGPGLLCRAMHIDRSLNGTDLCGESLWIERPKDWPRHASTIGTAPRIGVDYAGEWAEKPWRFFDTASPYVSTVSAARRKRALASEQGDRKSVFNAVPPRVTDG
jgi:DNA-3-methyladenine glycosylase